MLTPNAGSPGSGVIDTVASNAPEGGANAR